jgi:hypothetical protein
MPMMEARVISVLIQRYMFGSLIPSAPIELRNSARKSMLFWFMLARWDPPTALCTDRDAAARKAGERAFFNASRSPLQAILTKSRLKSSPDMDPDRRAACARVVSKIAYAFRPSIEIVAAGTSLLSLERDEYVAWTRPARAFHGRGTYLKALK